MVAVHLNCVCHGLWGISSHVGYIGRSVSHQAELGILKPSNPASKKYTATDNKGIKLVVFSPKKNEWTNSYDGIDTSAERMLTELDEEISRIEKGGDKVTKFSIVGYSLGGLVARYLVGLLYERKFFETVEPVNFTTFASPAIGIPRYDSFWSVVIRYLGARLLSRSGSQLYENDRFLPSSLVEGAEKSSKAKEGIMSRFSFAKEKAAPLLLVMADPRYSFFKALSAFERIEVYANAVNDRTVPFPTGAIEAHDPFALAKARAIKVAKLRGDDTDVDPDLDIGGLEIVLQEGVPLIVSYKTIPLPSPPTPEEIAKQRKRPYKFKLPLLLRPTTYPFSRPVSLFIIVFLPITLPLSVLFLITRFVLQGRDSRKRIKTIRKDVGGGRKGMLERVGVQIREVVDEVIDEVAQPDNPDSAAAYSSSTNYAGTSTPNSEASSASGDDQTPMLKHPALVAFAQSTSGTGTPPLARPTSPSLLVDESATGSTSKPYPSDPILSEAQKEMIKNLNSIPQLKKHFAYFPRARNAHGTIVVRDPAFEMHRVGMKVVDSWAKDFRL